MQFSGTFQKMCEEKNVPYQHFVNRSDVAGGSTLGNIANTHVSLNTVDIGTAQLGMHSSHEQPGVLDLDYMIAGMEAFYNSAVVAQCDGAYDIPVTCKIFSKKRTSPNRRCPFFVFCYALWSVEISLLEKGRCVPLLNSVDRRLCLPVVEMASSNFFSIFSRSCGRVPHTRDL